MKRYDKKMLSRSFKRGETLVEILVAVLIIALGAGLFATMYSAAMNVNMSARQQDERFYDAIGKLEDMIGGGGADATVSEGEVVYEADADVGSGVKNAEVDVYTEDGMSVYKDKSKEAEG